MNILFIGDIVGAPGRDIVKTMLPSLKEQYQIDFVIANGENAAHGKGITPKIYQELKAAGIDVITLGNHAYAKKEGLSITEKDLVYPGNLNGLKKDQFVVRKSVKDTTIDVLSISGQAFMENVDTSCFDFFERYRPKDANILIVDFHGEATAEKKAFAHMFYDRVSAVVGTHTHVQTADEQIIQGCGFITDVGMCGPFHSIIGREINEALAKMVYRKSTTYTIAEPPAQLNAVVLSFKHNRCVKIQRIAHYPTEIDG